jgi:hypothetical protein
VTKSCDCVLWAGDMNFRVDMSHQEVLGLCTESNYDQILLKDEFRTLQKQLGKKITFSVKHDRKGALKHIGIEPSCFTFSR